jgi:hypothetical protein
LRPVEILLPERGYPMALPCKHLQYCVFKIYDVNYFINYLKKITSKTAKDLTLIYNI